ncbi:thioredoxin family protein [Fulvivirgaceae bacterium LMO-SS25]
MQKYIDLAASDSAMNYPQYFEFTEKLLAQGKTTGTNQSPEMIAYTQLNLKRMKRWNKTYTPSAAMSEAVMLAKPMIWLVITEPWCGDAAHNVPALAKIADLSDAITMKLVLRDEHPELMDEFLTNGSKSIPKLICLDAASAELLGTWGPRPEIVQNRVMAFKAAPDKTMPELYEEIHAWYNGNKQAALESEFVQLLANWANKQSQLQEIS